MKIINFSFLIFFIVSCSSTIINDSDSLSFSDSTELFNEINSSFNHTDLLVPEGFSYKVLFSEGDSITRIDGLKFPAKGYHDLSVFIPDTISPNLKGQLYISHETKYKDDGLGDGGGATIFTIEKNNGTWEVVGEYNHIDFSEVGFTNRNCGGSLTPNGTIFTCEETWSRNTEHVYLSGNGLRDTTWVNGRPAWQNMGFVVEVDPNSRKAIKKHYQMGKFIHEDAHCSKDGKSVYLTDDMNPGIFYKFIPNTAYDYTEGVLYAFQESKTGESGKWLEMPSDTSSWLKIRDVALEKGATMYIRHEWLEEIDGKIYISETGQDYYNLTQSHQKGGRFSKYATSNLAVDIEQQNFDDPYGRVLVFDPENKSMKSLVEGGLREDSGCFSNPDCNTSVTINNKTYLVLSEDIIGVQRKRSGNQSDFYNEIYFLDMDIEKPTVNSLKRFAIAPKGAETTGVIFTPDNKHMILNIQHPDPSNPPPFNKSCTVLISGF